MPHRSIAPICLCCLLLGCADEEGPASEEEPTCPPGMHGSTTCTLDIYEVGELVASIDQGGTYLEPVNREPFVQQHGPEKLRIVYASTNPIAEAFGATVTPADLYRTIDPTDLSATFEHDLPVGTMFVHYTPEGPPYGAMFKQAEGTDPDNNDWFYGRFDEHGYPASDYEGQACRDCHVLDDRPARTDMLWGVPRAAL